MEERSRAFLMKLLETSGPAGYEEPVLQVWADYVAQFVTPVQVMSHGDRYAILHPDKPFKVMISGHADEVGLMVNYIDDNGFIYVGAIGGVDVAVLLSQHIEIITPNGVVPGVISKKAFHLLDRTNDKPPKLHELWIDIGSNNREETEKRVRIGDPIVWGGGFKELANGLAVARNFDNRTGCYVAAETLRRLAARKDELKVSVISVAGVQEETGVWGIAPLVGKLRPDIGIAIDVTHDTNTPTISKNQYGDVKCGRGPSIQRGVRSSEKLFNGLEKTAKAKGIPYQIDLDFGRTHTDADPMSERGKGASVNIIGIPCRYMHTSTEVVSLIDLENAVMLLTEYILSLDGAGY